MFVIKGTLEVTALSGLNAKKTACLEGSAPVLEGATAILGIKGIHVNMSLGVLQIVLEFLMVGANLMEIVCVILGILGLNANVIVLMDIASKVGVCAK